MWADFLSETGQPESRSPAVPHSSMPGKSSQRCEACTLGGIGESRGKFTACAKAEEKEAIGRLEECKDVTCGNISSQECDILRQ